MSDVKHVIDGGPCTFIIFTLYESELNNILIKINSLFPSHNFKFMPKSYRRDAPMRHSIMIEGVVMDEKHLKQIEKLCNNMI